MNTQRANSGLDRPQLAPSPGKAPDPRGPGLLPPLWGILPIHRGQAWRCRCPGRKGAGGRRQALTSQPSTKPDPAGPSGPKSSPPSSLCTVQCWLPEPPTWAPFADQQAERSWTQRVRAELEGAKTELGNTSCREQRWVGGMGEWGAGATKPTSSRRVRKGAARSPGVTLSGFTSTKRCGRLTNNRLRAQTRTSPPSRGYLVPMHRPH